MSDYDGRQPYRRPQGAPKPPPEIWAEMEVAGKAGDDARLGIARARYAAWLADNGYGGPTQLELEAPAPTEVTR